MVKGLQYPPVDGSLLHTDILEFNATNNPDATFFIFPDGSGGLCKVSHLEFYRASHRAAHLVRGRFKEGQVVAVIARIDTVLQHALTMGMIIAGVIPQMISYRLSADAVAHLMRATSCGGLIRSRHDLHDLTAGVEAQFSSEGALETMEVPSFTEVYPKLGHETASDAFERFDAPAKRSALQDITLYLHTSGSTGYPKPVRHTHQMGLNWCNQAPVADFRASEKKINLGTMALPAFHVSGLYNQLYVPLAALTPACVFAPTSAKDPKALPTAPDAQNVLESIQSTSADALIIYPSILEQWASSEKALEVLKSLSYIGFIGSALSPKSGEILLKAGVRFTGVYAATELGALTASILDESDWEHWQYVRFVDPYGIRWVQKSKNLYECQVLSTDKLQVAVENLDDVPGYASGDLFEKHPTVEGLWKYAGRAKNLFLLSEREGVIIEPVELAIVGNRYVKAAKVFQSGRRFGLLVEPSVEWYSSNPDESDPSRFVDAIWPDVQLGNQHIPLPAVITQDVIIVTSKTKPLQLSAKGTVMDSSLKAYDTEIAQLGLFTVPSVGST
ncbi:hypothetical protein HYDPIDRAFT_132077 [Hydnomerulius pinastri MD-312]|uniref:AMP-dependent synthetase/ligase domain-containing protein n=1 Tax=Hydnomerulius pinastri MD-312 TaxID=994086 RepID=A0A0C9WFJ3_9AGAM|nr:hypothetical protein HYDPIDRAFT_132077 [Hydnomerulius pinastri MD-312]